jgi:hypothetical protein
VLLTSFRSANPAALLSSRLATYMRRTWTAISPCPVAKELIPVHPRKVFYYLTTMPRQELPASALEVHHPVIGGRGKEGPKRIISPSLSNASQDDEASNFEERKRAALSPSPEVDLSLDLDEMSYSGSVDSTPGFPLPQSNGPSFMGSIPNSRRQSADYDRDLGLNRRAQSPALEGDEKEFTATARDMRMRGMVAENTVEDTSSSVKMEKAIESIETDEIRGNTDAVTLFSTHAPSHASKEAMLLSSPLVKPSASLVRPSSRMNNYEDISFDLSVLDNSGFTLSWDMRRPQSVGLDELDDLFNTY